MEYPRISISVKSHKFLSMLAKKEGVSIKELIDGIVKLMNNKKLNKK